MAVKVDKNFLESILHEPIKSFSFKEGSASGDNVAGALLAITCVTENNQEIHLVHKTFPGDDSPSKQYAVENQIFRTEAQFYSVVVPKLEQLVNNRREMIAKEKGNVMEDNKYEFPIPKFYSAFNDDKNDYITLGDLRPSGYKMLDKYSGLEYNVVSLVLKELSAFHAYSYYLIKYYGEQLFTKEFSVFKQNLWLKSGAEKQYQSMLSKVYQNTLKIVRNSKHQSILKEKIDPSHCYAKLIEVPLKTDSQLFPVLIHGDLWVNNILLKFPQDAGPQTGSKKNNDKPESLKFIDFQLVRRGNIYEDLLYFIFTSTTPKFRQQHLSQVLNEYYDNFYSTLKAIDFPMPANFTRGSFIDGFYDGILPTFIYLLFAIPMQLGDFSGGEKNLEHSPVDTGDVDEPVRIMINSLWKSLSNSPRAIQRVNDITNELFELNIV